MAEAKKRKVHSAEFKGKVGLEALRGVKTVNEITQLHGVHPVMVSQWKKEILAGAGTLFEGKRGPKAVTAQDRATRWQARLDTLDGRIERISELTGFQTPLSLRQHFKKRFQVTPRDWRRTFGQKAVAALE